MDPLLPAQQIKCASHAGLSSCVSRIGSYPSLLSYQKQSVGETMPKPKVFVTRIIPDKGLAMIKDICDVDLWPHELPPTRDELLRHVRGVDGLLCLLTDRIDGEVMEEAGPQLKVISNHAV